MKAQSWFLAIHFDAFFCDNVKLVKLFY